MNEPQVETRNRKRLRPNSLAPWELRVGNVRVFYDVEEAAKVTILAIGTKDRNKLYIVGSKFEFGVCRNYPPRTIPREEGLGFLA